MNNTRLKKYEVSRGKMVTGGKKQSHRISLRGIIKRSYSVGNNSNTIMSFIMLLCLNKLQSNPHNTEETP